MAADGGASLSEEMRFLAKWATRNFKRSAGICPRINFRFSTAGAFHRHHPNACNI